MTESSVSIIMPLHNKGAYVAQAVSSALDQTHSPIELIIVENNSTDGGADTARRLAEKDSRARFFDASAEVKGPAAARNYGIDRASGAWVLFLDADDLLGREYLSRMLATAKNVPSARVVAAPWKEFRAASGTDGMAHEVKEPLGYRGGRPIEDLAVAITCWAVHAAIVRRDWLRGPRRWPEELENYLAEDTVFWFRVVSGATIAYCSAAGALYRTQTEGCRTNYEAEEWFEGNNLAIRANISFMKSSGKPGPSAGQKETLVRFYSNMYAQCRRDGNDAVAARCLAEADRWLRSMKDEGGTASFPMRLRRLIGIPVFESMRKYLLLPGGAGGERMPPVRRP